jgi:hypothetical protein
MYSAKVMTTPASVVSQTSEQPRSQLALTQSLSGLPPGLDAELQQLWHYFVSTASGTMSCHKQMQNETCRVLLPMAFKDPALRYAIFAFSSAHKANQTDSESSRGSLKWHAASLRTKSIGQLRQEIVSGHNRLETIFATCLILCLGTLCHENEEYNSWRTHLQGARAIMSAIYAAQSDSTNLDPSISFLRRRYSLLEMVASLTPDGFPAEDSSYGSFITSSQPTRAFFDDYAGCYPEIFEIFHQIGAFAWERRQREHDSYNFVPLPDPDFELQAANLESRLLEMIERDESTRPCFSPSLQETLDEKQTLEFAYCNLLLEYTALIHIRAQIMNLDSEAMEIQQPVKMIIHLVQQLEPPSGLSPVLGVNTALFIAGRYAFGADRTAVQSLLIRFHRKMYNYNMINAIDILDLIWRQVDSGQKNIGMSCTVYTQQLYRLISSRSART